ncbi:MAG: lysophospholipid acyltransferase family protein [Smithellaceae bacterium]
MFKKLRNLATTEFVSNLLYRIIRFYCATFRLTVINEKQWRNDLERGVPVLLCAWHQQFFPLIRYFKEYEKYHPSLMISKSLDGEIIANIAERSGWHAVRGSSSRDGGVALKEMTEMLKKNGLAAHILDGPRGPAGVVKAGIISLAQATDAFIVPVFVKPEKAWYFKSWDKFMLPKPFSCVSINFGESIKLPPLQAQTDFENHRLMLEKIMQPYLKR